MSKEQPDKENPGKEFYDEIRRKVREEKEKEDTQPSLEQRLGMEAKK